MKVKKFLILTSLILSVFLFLSGILVLKFMSIDDVVNAGNNLAEDLFSRFRLNGPVNILIMGGDKVNKNTDTMLVVNYNPVNAKISILSIPRDTKVSIKNKGTQKINFAFPYGGGKFAAETVGALLDIKIQYYIYIDTAAFQKIVDELGGVDYDIPVNMDYDDPLQNLHIHLKKGRQHLSGAEAEQFMRFRQPTKFTKEVMQYYDGSDLKRIEAQQSFIKELIRQKANIYYFTKLSSIIKIAFDHVETNLKLDEALKLTRNLGMLNIEEIQMFKLPGNGDNSSGASYYIINSKEAGKITGEFFVGTGTFADNTNTNTTKTPSGTKSGGSNTVKPPPPPAETTQPSVTIDNPSNAETNLEGTTAPEP